MDPSNHDGPPFTAGMSLDPHSPKGPPPPVSPSLPSPSLLSPADATPRSASKERLSTPRRMSSSTSLRDERRKSSTPVLKKQSSTASLRSAHNSSGSPSPRLSRRPSSNFATSPTTTTTMSNIPQAPPTAASVAAEYFQKDVDWHHTADLRSKTLVVVHDACYGHRFARPRSSKATLGSIVERPERVRAGVLGVSAAYVRLGRRHAGETYAPHPSLDPRILPTSPPFQIRKTARSLALTAAPVAHVHGTKWMEDLKTMCDAAESRLALNGKELVRPRSSTGKDDRAPEFHQGDLYLCSESLNAFQGALGGVCDGVDAVFNESSSTKRAFVCIRPPGHHCSSGLPSGFCWINNVHVGISYAAMTHGLTHAAILDFDLHHGDGSQDITWEQNKRAAMTPKNAAGYKKARIGYFSLHDINSYPCEMGDLEKVRNASVCIDKAHNQSIWNVHLDPWKNESEFWDLYATKYSILIEKARAFLRLHTERLASIPNGPAPKAAIFLSAGFDASEWEGAGMQRHKVNVPTDFYARFTADVVRMAEEEGLGTDGRVISVLEGGYSDRALTSGVFSHISGLSDTTASPQNNTTEQDRVDRLATEMTDRLGLHETQAGPVLEQQQQQKHDPICNPAWWSSASLAELEALVYPPPQAPKGREKSAPTYFAPTQSFTAKVVNPMRERKSNGSTIEEPELPLPEVDWATAAHELSKILIPGDRVTTSCRPEELNAEASRQRRERQAAAEGIPLVSHAPAAAKPASTDDSMAAPEASRMQLRIRKPKPLMPSTPKAETPKRQTAKGNRRTTIDPASDLAPLESQSPTVSSNRRKSAAPTSMSDAAGVSRPGTAASVRSTVSTGQRKTSSSRSATPKRSASPRKSHPPVPPVPSGFMVDASAGASSEPAPSEPEPGQQDDVDTLAAGVRKLNIKLKVPNPEENAARERAAERRFMDSMSSPIDTILPDEKSEPFKSDRPGSPDMSAIPNTITVNRPGNSRKASPMQSSFISPPLTPGINQESFQQGPATVPAAHPKHALPVFSSTGAIPFAPAPVSAPTSASTFTSTSTPAESESRPSTSSHGNSDQSGFIFVDEQDYQERHA